MKRALLFCAMIFATLTVPSAKADNFTISFDGGSLGYSGSGIFTGSETSLGVFDITGVISGSVTDPGFGSSAIVAVSNAYGSDNTLYYPNGGQYFDLNGLSFTLANGVDINLFDYVDGGTLFQSALQSNPSGDITEFVTDSVSISNPAAVTPEPNSLILMATAAILSCCVLYRRRTQAMVPVTFQAGS